MQPSPLIPPPPPGIARHAPRPSVLPKILGGTLLVALIALVAAHRPLIRWIVEEQASARGLSLRFDDLEVGLGEVTLTKVGFGLQGQNILRGESPSVTLGVGLLGLNRVEAAQARVALVGSAAELADGLARWRSKYTGSDGDLDVKVSSMSAEVRSSLTSAPWLSMSAALAPSRQGGAVQARDFNLFGVQLGAQTFGWSAGKKTFALWAGDNGGHSRLELPSTSPPSARLIVKNAPLARLAQPLGLPSAQSASIDMQGDFVFSQGVRGKLTGAFRGVSLADNGWSGLVLGSQTQFGAQIGSTPDFSKIFFQNLSVQSGGLAMQGGAELSQSKTAAALKGQLAGSVPCSMLARNAASAAVGGGAIGGLAGAVAGAVVGGAVSISVGFEFDTNAPRAGAVHPAVGVGCNINL